MRLRTNAKLGEFVARQSEKIKQSIKDMDEFRLNTSRATADGHYSEM